MGAHRFLSTRAQVVLEFLIVVAIATTICIIYLAIGTDLLTSKSEEQRISALNSIGYMVQDELILAATVQDGYTRSFTIPQSADRFMFVIDNDETTVTLSSGTTILTYTIPQISGTLQHGENVVTKRGTIEVNP